MKTITRYLVTSYLATISTCLFAFVSIYLIIDILERFSKFSRAGVPLNTTLFYFVCKIPGILAQTTPMALLMGTMILLGSLSKSNEITAMRSSGISLVKIGTPLILVSLCISLGLLYMQEAVIPMTSQIMERIENEDLNRKPSQTILNLNNIWIRSENSILEAKHFEREKSILRGVTIWVVETGFKPVLKIDAASAKFTSGGLLLTEARKRFFSTDGHNDEGKETSLFFPIKLDSSDMKSVTASIESMGFFELYNYTRNIAHKGFDPTIYKTTLHAKISLPFAAVVMTFLAIPFSLRDSRSGSMGIGIGLSIIIGFSYFVTNSLLISLGQAGALPPVLAAWSANMLFTAAGLWLTLTVDS